MNNSRRYFINALMLSAVSVAMRAVAVSFNAYVTKKIGTEAVGLFTLVMSVYSFAVTLASSGVNLAAVRQTSAVLARCEAAGICGKDKRRMIKKEFRGCIKYSFFFGILSGLLLFISADFIGEAALSDVRTVPSLRVLALSLVPISLSAAAAGFFTGIRKVWKNAVVAVSEQLVKIFLVSALLVIIAPRGIEYACLAVVGGSAVSEGASLIMSLILYFGDRTGNGEISGRNGHQGFDKADNGRSKMTDEKSALSRTVSIAFPVAVGSYVRQGLVSAEHLAIPRGLAENGANYSAALSSYGVLHGMVFPLILFPSSVIGAFAALLIPEISAALAIGNKSGVQSIARRSVQICLWFSIGISVIFMTFSGELGNAVYSNYEAGRYVAVFAPLVPVMYLDTCVDAVLKGMGDQVFCMKVNILDAAMSLILVLVLVPRMGIMGYVVCVFATECVNAALSIGRLIGLSGIRFRAEWLLFPAASAAVSSCIARVISYTTLCPAAAAAAVCVSLYILLSLCLYTIGKKTGLSH